MDINDKLNNAMNDSGEVFDVLVEAQDFIRDLRATNDMLRTRGDDWKTSALDSAEEVVEQKKQSDVSAAARHREIDFAHDLLVHNKALEKKNAELRAANARLAF